jgi:hypothetical protein
MRSCTTFLLACACGLAAAGETPLFDGRTFTGWDGDTAATWRIEDGMLVAGSLERSAPRNEFLATTASYGDFILRLDYQLVGSEGFVNSGVQVRSVRIDAPANEMKGYQADIGKGWTGCLYDESRRNQVIAKADPALIDRLEKPGDWNHYEVRCEGPRIRISLNGGETVDYRESDAAIPLSGRIGVQIHGGGKTIVRFRNLTIEALPPAP